MPKNRLTSFLPDAAILVQLEPEAVAGGLLRYLEYQTRVDVQPHDNQKLRPVRRDAVISQANVLDFPPEHQEQVLHILMEAWIWLEREGLIAPKPEAKDDTVFITRRGHRLKDEDDLEQFRKGLLLPKSQLHPVIAQGVQPLFINGKFDAAVLEAYRLVEDAVRKVAGYERYTKDMMGKAFGQDGPLRDGDAEPGEQDALAMLFRGAYGVFRNPVAHRVIGYAPEVAVELIMLASYLMRVVDAAKERLK